VTTSLYDLLPALYRIRDAKLAGSLPLLTVEELAELNALSTSTSTLTADQQARLEELQAKAARGPLQSLLMVIEEQVAALAEDLDQLYDDEFIETCAPWVIPYIGDLIGYQSVKGIAPAIDNPRSDVAETISLRRRKGTILVIEQLARDATGWGAHAVEFFRILGDTQYLNHLRPGNHFAPDLRRWQAGLYVDTAFDRTSHRIDVRRIASGRGRYNIQNIGIFLWTLDAYSLTDAPATAAATNAAENQLCYRFDPLGIDAPLFHRAISQGEQIEAPAGPPNVADRLRRRVLCDDLGKGVGAAFYGPGKSVVLMLDGRPVNPYELRVANLSGADGAWLNLPDGAGPYAAVIDPELGRIALPPSAGAPRALTASTHYGFSGDLGGGEYPRAQTFVVTDPAAIVSYPDPAAAYTNLPDALAYAVGQLPTLGAVALELAGSVPYPLASGLEADLPAGTTLELRAADGARPTILLDGELTVTGAKTSTFILNGLTVAAGPGMAPASPSPVALVHVPAARPDGSDNDMATVRLKHCTLAPGWSLGPDGTPLHPDGSSLVAEAPGAAVLADRSILGALRTHQLVPVELSDTIIDATARTLVAYAAIDGAAGGGALTMTGCTVVGKVHATLLSLVSDSIFWAACAAGDGWASGLVADRKQEGCVRFSFLPYKAVTPRRFECVEEALASAQPVFLAERYGHPAYLKLLAGTDDAIRRGADDGGEMGAFHYLLLPERESDLKTRVQEYLPAGLEFGVIYQT
jgi:hypothetical protein